MSAGQSRRASAAEACAGVALGYGINLAGQIYLYPLLGIHVSLATNFGISLVFTAISVARTYSLRRLFNALHRLTAIKASGSAA